MIEDYLTLTTKLVHGYIEEYAPVHLTSKLVESSRFNQYLVSNGDELKVTVNVSEVAEKTNLVNFITIGTEKVDTVLIDWNAEALKTELPLEEISLELRKEFNRKIDLSINSKISKLFHYSGNGSHEELQAKDPKHPSQPHPHPHPHNPLGSETERRKIPDMPDFDDEYEILGTDKTTPTNRPFPNIGDRDLNPPGLPKYPEMKPYLDPSGGNGDGGMYPLGEHPIFGGHRGSGNSSRLGVPPGARYDDPMGEDSFDALGSGLPGNMGGSLGRGNSGSGFPGFGNPGSSSSGSGPFGF
mmetsp:Transcript_1484/g.1479  ORF Transcript_1484/g.1479 Transcript_1484/m.1479 type:complete len:298 (+) Transcript_1484:194-1087(+)